MKTFATTSPNVNFAAKATMGPWLDPVGLAFIAQACAAASVRVLTIVRIRQGFQLYAIARGTGTHPCL